MERFPAHRNLTFGGFNTVLGSQQGSATAQAQRDAAEKRAEMTLFLQQEFAAFEEQVRFRCADALPPGNVTAVGIIGRTYSLDPPHQSQSEGLQEALREHIRIRGVRELAAVAALGDPATCPGFSAPAVLALSSYFKECLIGKGNPGDERALISARGFGGPHVLNQCLAISSGGEEGQSCYYERLRPLCESLADFVDRQLADKLGEDVGCAAVNVLRNVPVSVYAQPSGPLRGFVLAFARRLDDLVASDYERNTLCKIIRRHKNDPEFEDAFAPILQHLIPTSRKYQTLGS